jgi:hypothetical protein
LFFGFFEVKFRKNSEKKKKGAGTLWSQRSESNPVEAARDSRPWVTILKATMGIEEIADAARCGDFACPP